VKLAWWPHTTDERVASFRLRCLQIVGNLRTRGHDAYVYVPGGTAPDVLVLSKRYDANTLAIALALSREGTRLVLDLCDNHFQHDGDGPLTQRSAELRHAIQSVHLVTAASEALAETIRRECPDAPQIHVIDDAAEDPSEPRWVSRWSAWGAEARLNGLKLWLQTYPLHRRLVWFGSHGSPGVQAGLTDLAKLYPLLASKVASDGPLSLTIVSNHAARAAEITSGWTVPTHYLEWKPTTFSRALREHSLALIPITQNPFTRCKTANHVLSAFTHGLNVVADAIPSYSPFKECAVFGNWEFGLGPYLDMAGRRNQDVSQGQMIARERYSLDHVTAQWLDVAQSAMSQVPADPSHRKPSA
jgi:hypothetical protein